MATQKKKPNIVSVHLGPEAKAALDKACADRGMTIKSLLGRLIEWFNSINRTEQSIVLGQVERSDVQSLAQLVIGRHAPDGRVAAQAAGKRKTAAKGAER